MKIVPFLFVISLQIPIRPSKRKGGKQKQDYFSPVSLVFCRGSFISL